jgi:hypothetical protein
MKAVLIVIVATCLLVTVPLLRDRALGETGGAVASGRYFGSSDAGDHGEQKDGGLDEKRGQFQQKPKVKKESGRRFKGGEAKGAAGDSDSPPAVLFGPKTHDPF